jgi:pSer/pThr/pTyr-binding forkhead associated (FHA) protein
MRAQLIPADGGGPIEIVKDITLIGRREECDLRLEHKAVSKFHCVLVKTDGLLLLRDLGSTNGTKVNGQRVRRAALLPNDQLSVSHFQYRIYLGPGETSANPFAEHTQALDADELARMMERAGTPLPDGSGTVNDVESRSSLEAVSALRKPPRLQPSADVGCKAAPVKKTPCRMPATNSCRWRTGRFFLD